MTDLDPTQTLLNLLRTTKDLPENIREALEEIDLRSMLPHSVFANEVGLMLQKRDTRLAELETKLEGIQGKLARSKTAWAIPREIPESTLPVPRLELRVEPIDLGRRSWTYMLVRRLIGGDGLEGAVLGQTIVSHSINKGLRNRHGEVSLPIQQDNTIRFDAQRLGLPAYAVSEEEAVKLDHLDPRLYEGILKTHRELGDRP